MDKNEIQEATLRIMNLFDGRNLCPFYDRGCTYFKDKEEVPDSELDMYFAIYCKRIPRECDTYQELKGGNNGRT